MLEEKSSIIEDRGKMTKSDRVHGPCRIKSFSVSQSKIVKSVPVTDD